MISSLKRNLLNIPGWRTNRKLIVIESDDWGSIRMPSVEVFNDLKEKGYNPESDPYLKYDALENNLDLEMLFEVLQMVKDKNENHPVITANTIVSNPDFDKIKANNFKEYFYEPFTTTLKNYPNSDKVYEMILDGIKKKIYIPQFHGREHLNVDQWMLSLQNNDKNILEAFNYKMLSISSLNSKMKFGYMEGLDFFSEMEQQNKLKILEEGYTLFEKLFGYKSSTFIANCYIWDELIEQKLSELGVKNIQGILNQRKPILKGTKHTK